MPSLFHIEGLFRFNGYSWKEALRSYLSSSAFLLIQCREITTGGRAVQTQLAKLNLLELKNSATVDWYQLMQADPGLTWWDVERMRRKKESHLRRIRLINHLIRSKIKPEWMVFSDLPVLPPDLRPMLELKEGELISSDLNELYRRVVCRNNTLIDNTALLELTLDGWAGLQKKLIQLAVDQLLDNSKVGRPVKDRHDRIYKAFSDLIQGKEGRFRENLLGKRVDYSGRSVIAVGPYLKLEQCGLPEEMAMELFQPFVIRRLIEQEISPNLRAAKSLIQRKVPIIWNVLQNVVKEYAVLLNRAPTLHRLGIQAFQPILTRERAIRLHPLVCTGFNADFDGDQMAVHVPLAIDAQMEARLLMFADQNLLSPATGEAIAVPSQDMLLGLYVLTLEGDLGIYSSRYWPTEHFSPIDSVLPARIPAFSAPLQVLNTYLGARLHPHSPIWMAMNQQTLVIHDVSFDEPIETQYQVFGDNLSIYEYGQTRANRHGHSLKQYIYTTVGRVLFNYYLQEALQRPYGSFPL